MRSALFQFFTIKAMTIENIENHMAYTCKCGGVNFALLKSGAIECNKCSTTLNDVKWWAGGMGSQLARAIKAEAERDALKAAMPVGELTDSDVRAVGGIVHRDGNVFFTNVAQLNRAILAAASTQPVREPLTDEQIVDALQNLGRMGFGPYEEGFEAGVHHAEAANGITKKGAPGAAKEQTP